MTGPSYPTRRRTWSSGTQYLQDLSQLAMIGLSPCLKESLSTVCQPIHDVEYHTVVQSSKQPPETPGCVGRHMYGCGRLERRWTIYTAMYSLIRQDAAIKEPDIPPNLLPKTWFQLAHSIPIATGSLQQPSHLTKPQHYTDYYYLIARSIQSWPPPTPGPKSPSHKDHNRTTSLVPKSTSSPSPLPESTSS